MDLEDVFDNVQNKVNTIELTYKNKNLEHVGDIAKKISYDIKNGKLNSNWIESGFKGLDRIIQGGSQ
ncbi:replicative DNA helicase domain-containing protein [Borreliella burgdorferi]|uniref:replicative DNA helicase domain-containing protein n=1 Tax=Borreliella burgdorferi TaxID=139 RepID=UPI0004215AC1|nr:replicative DNA helicase domain-containing protein [Borreliella burgdorferi]